MTNQTHNPKTSGKTKKPKFYISHFFFHPDFTWKIFGFGIYIGRVNEIGKEIVWNIYTPWFNFGYAW